MPNFATMSDSELEVEARKVIKAWLYYQMAERNWKGESAAREEMQKEYDAACAELTKRQMKIVV